LRTVSTNLEHQKERETWTEAAVVGIAGSASLHSRHCYSFRSNSDVGCDVKEQCNQWNRGWVWCCC